MERKKIKIIDYFKTRQKMKENVHTHKRRKTENKSQHGIFKPKYISNSIKFKMYILLNVK